MSGAIGEGTVKRGRRVLRLIEPEQFASQRKAALLSRSACSELLGVSERSIRNWETGRTAVPYAAFKLLRVLSGGELPGAEWKGFWVQGSTLWTPEGKGYDASELAYISNVFAMARYWLRDYHAKRAADQAILLIEQPRWAASR